MPVAHEIRFESRSAPVLVVRGRARGANKPTRLRGARFKLHAEAQKKYRDAPFRRSQHQPPAGCEIENFRFAGYLDQHGAERGRGERIAGRAQSAFDIGRAQHDNTRRVCSKFDEARRRKLAMLERGKILTDP